MKKVFQKNQMIIMTLAVVIAVAKKKYNGPEMQKRIKKIIEEEVAKA